MITRSEERGEQECDKSKLALMVHGKKQKQLWH